MLTTTRTTVTMDANIDLINKNNPSQWNGQDQMINKLSAIFCIVELLKFASIMFISKTASNFYALLLYKRNPDKMMIYAHEMWEVITVLTR